MARTRKSGQETLEQKIELAKQKVIKTKAAHEKAVDELQVLLDKKKALQTQDLMKAILLMMSGILQEMVFRRKNSGS